MFALAQQIYIPSPEKKNLVIEAHPICTKVILGAKESAELMVHEVGPLTSREQISLSNK